METEFIKTMICNDLHKLGVNTGDTLLVHSSLKSLGPVPGEAETVINALLEVLGNNGTLLFPALSFSSVNAASPYFDQQPPPAASAAWQNTSEPAPAPSAAFIRPIQCPESAKMPDFSSTIIISIRPPAAKIRLSANSKISPAAKYYSSAAALPPIHPCMQSKNSSTRHTCTEPR